MTILAGNGLFALAQAMPEETNICINQEARKQISKPDFFKELSQISRFWQDKNLIMMGELHSDMPGSRRQILSLLKNFARGKTCFFYELRSDETVVQILARHQGDKAYESFNQEFQEIHSTVQKLGLKEITVDSDVSADYDLDSLNHRNQAMGENISRHFADGTCERGILIVGKAHLTEGNPTERNVQHFLSLQVRPLTINLQNAGERLGFSTSEVLSAWTRVCPKGKKLPLFKDLRFFETANLPKDLLLNPLDDTGNTGFWRHFDLTVLFP